MKLFKHWQKGRITFGKYLIKRTILIALIANICVNLSYSDSQDPQRLIHALKLLEAIPHGKKLVQDAMKLWNETSLEGVSQHLKWGVVSKTDAVLTRTLDQSTGQEKRIREVTVLLRPDQKLLEIALDLGHELTHATRGGGWDPYDPDLSSAKYIRQALEGKGGEVEALYQECVLAFEFYQDFGYKSNRCSSYRVDMEQAQVLKKMTEDFYKVGKNKNRILQHLSDRKAWEEKLSDQKPELYSSTGNAPYPLALLEEFDAITEAACQNSTKRIQSLTRAPASDENGSKELTKAQAFLNKRCADDPRR